MANGRTVHTAATHTAITHKPAGSRDLNGWRIRRYLHNEHQVKITTVNCWDLYMFAITKTKDNKEKVNKNNNNNNRKWSQTL